MGVTYRGPDRARRMLIIPDAHAHPGFGNERFDYLGAFIERERPDVVVCLGDFADMPSLSSYDVGKRSFEGRRYTHDVESTRDALRRLHSHVTYQPTWIMCLGNHEDRVNRATNDASQLDGTISINDLGFSDFGWTTLPYQMVATVAGYAIAHNFPSGVGGKPIGGALQAAAMVRLNLMSSIAGHSHVKDECRRVRPDGSVVHTIVAGCYAHPEQREGWNYATQKLWWHGVVVLDDAHAGNCRSIRWVSIDVMRDQYVAPPPVIVRPPSVPVHPAPPSMTHGHADPVDVSGLDLDDDVTTAGAPSSIAELARREGVDESTPRKWAQLHGRPWQEYRRKASA